MRSVRKILAGAGCGKTTALLMELDTLFQGGVQPEMVVFTTFTRKGANEATERAIKQFRFPRSRLPWFRTLHSLCWHFTQDMGRIMCPEDWIEIGRRTGERLTIQGWNPDGRVNQGVTRGDKLLAVWNKARLLMRPLDEVFAETADPSLTLQEIHAMVAAVDERKNAEGCIDFTDMLEEFLRRRIPFEPSHVLVDEMQDTAPLQWECIKKLAAGAHLWMAGDDDQCIYEYAGAVPDILIDTPGQSRVLGVTHRLPRAVHAVAERITERISKRIRKNITCRPDDGRAEWVTDPCLLDMRKGTWLMLARNNCLLGFLEDACITMGLAYTGGTRSVVRPEAWKAVRCYMRLTAGETVEMADVKKMYAHLYQNKGYTRGMKKAVTAAEDSDMSDIDNLRTNYGLLAKGLWAEVFAPALKVDELAYMKALDEKGELNAEPRIVISSIHGVKGGEADNVVLMTDMTASTHGTLVRNPDNEHRVWYVGVTRARHALYAVRPITDFNYPLPI